MSVNVLYIGNKLARHGYTVTTIDTLGKKLEYSGYQLRYASSQRAMIPRMLDMLWTTFRSKNWANVVLIDTYSTRNFWYAILVARLCDVLKLKYFPILHGGNLPQRITSNPKTVRRFIENASQVISPSEYLNVAFAKAEYHNITTIPNSIAIDEYPFQLREQITLKLLWVRSFASIYNPQMAIEVFAKLKSDYPEAQLTMVGPEKDGSLEECKKFAEKLQVDVNFTGKLSKADWVALSQSHHVFLNTTNFDNLPVSIIEAMALGFPIISTNAGGLPFLIKDGENGVLIDSNDVDAAVTAIKNLCNDSEFVVKLSQNARKTALNYNWLQVKRLWDEVLKR